MFGLKKCPTSDIAALKGWAADFISQRAEYATKDEEDEEVPIKIPKKKFQFQFKRNLAFLSYGGFYQGIFQEYLYNDQFNKLFGSKNDMKTAFMKVTFNMFVIAPFLCLPMAYLIKAVVFKQTLSSGMRNYMNDVQQNGLVVSIPKLIHNLISIFLFLFLTIIIL